MPPDGRPRPAGRRQGANGKRDPRGWGEGQGGGGRNRAAGADAVLRRAAGHEGSRAFAPHAADRLW